MPEGKDWPCLVRPWTFENQEARIYVSFADFSPVKIPSISDLSPPGLETLGSLIIMSRDPMLASLTFRLSKHYISVACLLLARPQIPRQSKTAMRPQDRSL
jgi:hypothetical protein